MHIILLLLILSQLLTSFEVENGDLVFQSLPHCELVDAIETSTKSPYSHCGIVIIKDDQTRVIEAIGPVREISYEKWLKQGRDGYVTVCRMLDRRYIPKMIDESYKFLGRPYDIHYKMDDENIYCSELIYKSILNAHGKIMARPNKLAELDWAKILPVIMIIEGGAVPLDREIITPVALTKSTMVKVVYSNYP